MSNEIKRDVEEIKHDADVQRALKHATASETPARQTTKTRDKLLFGTHIVLLLALGAFYYLLNLRFFGFAGKYLPHLKNLTIAAAILIVFLIVLRLLDVYLIGRVQNPVYRFNLRRVLRLTAWLVVSFVLLTFFFQNW